MKRFHCVALDQQWQTCTGTFAAASQEAAKQKVLSHGYSILQLREIPDDGRPENSFFESPAYPAREKKKRHEAQSSKAESKPERIRDTVMQFPRPVAIILAVVFFGIVIAWGVLSLSSSPPAEEVVRSYLSHGIQENWAEQYPLLTPRLTGHYGTAAYYQVAMGRAWLPDLSPASAKSLKITPAVLKHNEAYVRASWPGTVQEQQFEFVVTRRRWGHWKIDRIRNLNEIRNMIRTISRDLPQQQKDDLIKELQRKYGYSLPEIHEQVRLQTVDSIERDLRYNLSGTGQDAGAASETRVAGEAAVVETPVDDKLQEKLDEVLRSLDTLDE